MEVVFGERRKHVKSHDKESTVETTYTEEKPQLLPCPVRLEPVPPGEEEVQCKNGDANDVYRLQTRELSEISVCKQMQVEEDLQNTIEGKAIHATMLW